MVRIDSGVELCAAFPTERSVVCENGGGYDETRWWVRVNDGWRRLGGLKDLPTIADITVSLVEEDDPHGAACRSWGGRPAQVYWARTYQVRAPKGTRLLKRSSSPDFEGARKLLFGMPYRKDYQVYVLVGGERLVAEEIVARRAQEREAKPNEVPVSGQEMARRWAALAETLSVPEREASPPGFATNRSSIDVAEREGQVRSKRHRAVTFSSDGERCYEAESAAIKAKIA